MSEIDRQPSTAQRPTRTVLWQYGFRIDQTGVERWFHVDLHYGGANSAKEEQVVDTADRAVKAAAELGVDLTFTLLRRGHLTTTWSRWLKPEEVR